jgi:hypothetical protein
MNSTSSSTRPRGDITTVLDRAARDSQDGFFFPLDTQNSWFHRAPLTQHPTSLSIQEFSHKGTAQPGGRLTFEISALQSGDLLQAVILQLQLQHWLPALQVLQLQAGQITPTTPTPSTATPPYTFINCLGSAIIEYAEFEVGDQTIERITGEFIQAFLATFAFENSIIGFSIDGSGLGTLADIATNSHAFSSQRPFPTQDGYFFCLLPFFFTRTRLKQAFPLLSTTEGSVRIHVQLRPFDQLVRSTTHIRQDCTQTPLSQQFAFTKNIVPPEQFFVTSTSISPLFQDFRILTFTSLCTGSIRSAYLRNPFESPVKLCKIFNFSEPLKFLVSKPNPNTDQVDISLPLELNHPVQEILWVFRRKAVQINNDWMNFTPIVETQYSPISFPPPWLAAASIRVNGILLQEAEGDWWRWSSASAHRGGFNQYAKYVYGYSFARYPDEHQPSGTANMSRTQSVVLNLTVNVPIPIIPPSGFDAAVGQGWEVQVYVIHWNWIRFQNGLCQVLYAD